VHLPRNSQDLVVPFGSAIMWIRVLRFCLAATFAYASRFARNEWSLITDKPIITGLRTQLRILRKLMVEG